jgi:hypothetical protein
MRATCPVHYSLLAIMNPRGQITVFLTVQCSARSCNFLPTVCSALSFTVKDQVSHPHETGITSFCNDNFRYLSATRCLIACLISVNAQTFVYILVCQSVADAALLPPVWFCSPPTGPTKGKGKSKGKCKVFPVLFYFTWAPHHEGVLGSGGTAPRILDSALDGGEWLASRTCRLTPKERALGTHWIGGLVDLRAGLDMVVKRKCPVPAGTRTPRSSSP